MSEKILGQILGELKTLKGDIGTLKEDVHTLKEDVTTLKEDVTTLKEDNVSMRSDIKILKDDMQEMKLEQKTATQRLYSIENKSDIIQKQTAANAEQLSVVNDNVQEILHDNRSIQGVLGEHEVSIRTMRRKPV